MNKLTLTFSGIAVGVIFALVFFLQLLPSMTFGSSVEGQEASNYTVITSADASATALVELKSGTTTAVLGSIIVGSTSPAIADLPLLRIYSLSTTTATSTTYLIGELYEDSVGNIDYDLRAPNGLAVEVLPGFNGSYTITWK